MAAFSSFPDLVERVLERVLTRWVAENVPKPDQRVSVDLSYITITENKEPPHMATHEASITVAGDAPFGYEVTGIVVTNKMGVPVISAPTMTSTNEAICTAVGLSGARVWVKPLDATNPGDTCDLVGSFVDGSTDDDFVLHVTIAADRISTDASGVAVTELTADPTP